MRRLAFYEIVKDRLVNNDFIRESMILSTRYVRKLTLKSNFMLFISAVLFNLCIVGLLQYYATRNGDRLVSNRMARSYAHHDTEAEEGIIIKEEKNNLNWIYSEASSLKGKLKHLSDAISSATQTASISNDDSLSTSDTAGMHKIIGQRPGFFKSLSKYSDITTFMLSWHQSADDLTRKHAHARIMVNSMLPVKIYYRCVIDERFLETLQYPSNSSITKRNGHHSSQICTTDISTVHTAETFNFAYFIYHNMLPISIFEMAYYGRPPGLEEGGLNLQWNPPCVRCDRYPDFIAYSSIIQGGVSVIDSKGKVYYKDSLIIPFSCLYAWDWEPNSTIYRQAFQSADNLYSNVFVASQQFDNNYYHNFAECAIKVVLYKEFLQQNPDVFIHILSSKRPNDTFIKKIISILGVQNKLVTGIVRSNVTIVPMGMGCLNPAVLPLQLAARTFHEYISTMHSTELPWDSILVIKREDRQFMEHSLLIQELKHIITTSHRNVNMLEFDGNTLPSLEETMTMFYRAKIIIASHGAGLTNMIFSRPGTVIIEANCHAPMGRPCYRNMAYKLGLRYYGQLTTLTKDDGFRCVNGLNINFEAMKQVINFVLDEVLV